MDVVATMTNRWGTFFPHRIRVVRNPDRHTYTLGDHLAYRTPDGRIRHAREGLETDGGSIPRWAWWLVGHPFESSALPAFLVHDQACQDRTRPWREVHRELYPMLRAGGVGWLRADLMTRAVEWFGPRWSDSTEAT